VPARKAEKAQRRSLTADDVLDIIAAMPDQWQCFFSLLAESGCRVAELLGLRWANIHLGDDPYIYVCEQFRNGKTKALKTEACGCGSLLVNAGMDLKQVQQRLRHAQLATTLGCYVEEVDSGRSAADTMGGLLWGNRGDTDHPQTTTDEDARRAQNPHSRGLPQTPATPAADS
jgi:integrase